MNKAEKQAMAASLRNEATVLRQTRENYKEARANIEEKIKQLSERPQTQSVIWQKQYQQALKQQLDTAIDALSTKNYSNISEYLNGEYENGFIGTMYSLQKQGIPLAMPIDQKRVVKMVETGADGIKLSKRLYGNTTKLKNAVRREISIGLASGESYQDVAARLTRTMGVDYNKTVRIARTEAGRVQNGSRFDAMTSAKKNGADIVKQWDSTLDGRTRTAHRELDGQIRELDEYFEAEGQKAKHPHGFGVAWMDINCRCVVVQRARWAIDGSNPDFEDYTKFSRYEDFDRDAWIEGTLKEAARKNGAMITDLSDARSFTEFARRYKDVSKTIVATTAVNEIGVEVTGEVVEVAEDLARPIEKPPIRPKKADFSSTEAYEKARSAYKRERAAYEAKVDDWVKRTIEKSRSYDTKEKIKDWAKGREIDIADDVFEAVDVRFLGDCVETLDDMMRRYPQVEKMFKEFGNNFRIYTVDGLDEYLQANEGMGISRHWFRDYEHALRDYAYRTDLVYGDGTMNTSARHEFGHSLDSAIKSKRFYGGTVENMTDPHFEMDFKALTEYNSELKSIARKYGSDYSKVNEGEAFAEGFAEYTSNPNSEFGKAFGKFLAKWL